jgi:hypothetical protein
LGLKCAHRCVCRKPGDLEIQQWTCSPCVERAGAHAHHLKHDAILKLALMHLDEVIAHLARHRAGAEKMLMADGRTSLSWRSTSTSRHSRASSSSCGCPWPRKARCPFCTASFFQ